MHSTTKKVPLEAITKLYKLKNDISKISIDGFNNIVTEIKETVRDNYGLSSNFYKEIHQKNKNKTLLFSIGITDTMYCGSSPYGASFEEKKELLMNLIDKYTQ